MSVCGYASEYATVPSGVAQGSHLGPLLFILYINDIQYCFKNTHFLMYADDLKIFTTITSLADAEGIQQDLDRLDGYCRKSCLFINFNKCAKMTFTRNKATTLTSYHIAGRSIRQVGFIRDLGLTIDSKVSFGMHIDCVVARANKMLGFVFRSCYHFTSLAALKSLYFSFVYSQLHYLSSVWNPIYEVYIGRIERIQNKFLKYCYFKQFKVYPDGISYSDLRSYYGLKSLVARRRMNDFLACAKFLTNVFDSPSFLSSILIAIPQRSLRNHDLLHISRTNTNAAMNSPLTRICRTFNQVGIDVFYHTSRQIKYRLRVAVE